MKNKLLFITLVAIIIVTAGFFRSRTTPPSPTYPLGDTSATYVILKEEGIYKIQYEKGNEKGKITIGVSKVDLAQFVGKKVQISGNYPKTQSDVSKFVRTQQCVSEVCTPFDNAGTEYVTADVDSITEI